MLPSCEVFRTNINACGLPCDERTNCPVSVDVLQCGGDPVVLPQPDGVEGGEAGLLVDSLVSRHSAVGSFIAGKSAGVDIGSENFTRGQHGVTPSSGLESVVSQEEEGV